MLSQTTFHTLPPLPLLLMVGFMRSNKMQPNIRASDYGLYFIEPQPNRDAKELASELIGIDGVMEVQITSGDIGYVVAAKKEGSFALERFIKRNALKSRHIESHYMVSKR